MKIINAASIKNFLVLADRKAKDKLYSKYAVDNDEELSIKMRNEVMVDSITRHQEIQKKIENGEIQIKPMNREELPVEVQAELARIETVVKTEQS